MFTIALYDSVLIKATKADVRRWKRQRRRDGMKGQEGGRCGSWSYNITKIEIQKEDMTSDFSSWATPMIPVLCQKKQMFHSANEQCHALDRWLLEGLRVVLHGKGVRIHVWWEAGRRSKKLSCCVIQINKISPAATQKMTRQSLSLSQAVSANYFIFSHLIKYKLLFLKTFYMLYTKEELVILEINLKCCWTEL